VRKVMLNGPDGVKTEWLGHLGQPQLLAVHFSVREGVARVLKNGSITNVHGSLLGLSIEDDGLAIACYCHSKRRDCCAWDPVPLPPAVVQGGTVVTPPAGPSTAYGAKSSSVTLRAAMVYATQRVIAPGVGTGRNGYCAVHTACPVAVSIKRASRATIIRRGWR